MPPTQNFQAAKKPKKDSENGGQSAGSSKRNKGKEEMGAQKNACKNSN